MGETVVEISNDQLQGTRSDRAAVAAGGGAAIRQQLRHVIGGREESLVNLRRR